MKSYRTRIQLAASLYVLPVHRKLTYIFVLLYVLVKGPFHAYTRNKRQSNANSETKTEMISRLTHFRSGDLLECRICSILEMQLFGYNVQI